MNRHDLVSINGTDDNRAILSQRAIDVLGQIASDMESFHAQADEPGARIHALFTRLYWCTTNRWLDFLKTRPNPEFGYLVILNFYGIYKAVFETVYSAEAETYRRYWRRYQSLSALQTFESPISAHLFLVSHGARAHTRYDLENAIYLAAHDYRRLFGREPDLANFKPTIVSRATSRVFRTAAFDFIDMHIRVQSGWRRTALLFQRRALSALQPVWLPIFQHWRRTAWNQAVSRFEDAVREDGVELYPVFTSTALSKVSTGAPSWLCASQRMVRIRQPGRDDIAR